MSYDPKKLIAIAAAEVGYLEKKDANNLDNKTANAGSKNYTKYARDLDALGFYNGRKQSVAWCDIFVDWCHVQAFGLEAALKLTYQPLGKSNCGAGCKYSRQYYKKNGRLFDTPQLGDQIFFWPKDAIGGPAVAHTGLVYAVDSTYVYTIEGNTSGANGVVANGGGVCKKKYKLTYNRIAGYGRPDWGQNGTTDSSFVPEDSNSLKQGDKNDRVKLLQQNLMTLGYDLGTYGADGDFGKTTKAAVEKFQKEHNLSVTGVANEETLTAVTDALAEKETSEFPIGTKVIVVTSKSLNARVGDSQKYDSVGHVQKGEKYEWVATSPATGWHAIRMKKRICWVSPNYSKVEVA